MTLRPRLFPTNLGANSGCRTDSPRGLGDICLATVIAATRYYVFQRPLWAGYGGQASTTAVTASVRLLQDAELQPERAPKAEACCPDCLSATCRIVAVHVPECRWGWLLATRRRFPCPRPRVVGRMGCAGSSRRRARGGGKLHGGKHGGQNHDKDLAPVVVAATARALLLLFLLPSGSGVTQTPSQAACSPTCRPKADTAMRETPTRVRVQRRCDRVAACATVVLAMALELVPLQLLPEGAGSTPGGAAMPSRPM